MREKRSSLLAVPFVVFALALVCLFMPGTKVQAKTGYKHTIYGKATVKKYVNNTKKYVSGKKLKVVKKSTKILNKTCKLKLYYKGKTLRYVLAQTGKDKRQLYFYKNQLATMVNLPSGGKRQVFIQYYQYTDSSKADIVEDYLSWENVVRKVVGFSIKAKQASTKRLVMITKVNNTNIRYHILNAMGPDGYVLSMQRKPYYAKITSSTKFYYHNGPDTLKSKTRASVKALCSNDIGFFGNMTVSNGKVTKFVQPYMP